MTFDKFEEADRDKTRVEIESDTCATEISAAMHESQQYRYQSSIDHGLQYVGCTGPPATTNEEPAFCGPPSS
jgi:hypothetical protein